MKYRILSFFGFYFIIFSFLITEKVYPESVDLLLNKADSLFEKKSYIESKEIYERVFKQKSSFSPQMLLKLAYIEEGLNDFSSALFYLNCYRNLKFDTQIEDKILKLSKEKVLSGYQENIKSTLRVLLNNFFSYIIIFIISLTIIWGGFLILFYIRKKTLSSKAKIYFMSYLIFSSVILNFNLFLNKEAIIYDRHSLIMQGPSAGSKMLEMAEKGSKIEVLGTKDIWSKIIWNGENAYIRTKSIKIIEV